MRPLVVRFGLQMLSLGVLATLSTAALGIELGGKLIEVKLQDDKAEATYSYLATIMAQPIFAKATVHAPSAKTALSTEQIEDSFRKDVFQISLDVNCRKDTILAEQDGLVSDLNFECILLATQAGLDYEAKLSGRKADAMIAQLTKLIGPPRLSKIMKASTKEVVGQAEVYSFEIDCRDTKFLTTREFTCDINRFEMTSEVIP